MLKLSQFPTTKVTTRLHYKTTLMQQYSYQLYYNYITSSVCLCHTLVYTYNMQLITSCAGAVKIHLDIATEAI